MSKHHEFYPVFSLPENIKLVYDGRERTKTEAKAYYTALLEVIPFRVILLLSWHHEHFTGSIDDDLRRLGKKVADYIMTDGFHYLQDTDCFGDRRLELKSQVHLYDHVRSMLIDMGLYLAIMLLQLDHPEISWELITKGSKNYVHYNQAIIKGPGLLEYEPVWDSYAAGSGLIEGNNTYNRWAERYLRWVDVLEGREPRSLQGV